MKKACICFALLGWIVLTGCQTTTAYHWGDYEEQLYRMYAAPDQATAAAQLEALEADLQSARSADKPLPPGLRAHLGFLYFQLGRYDEARASFAAEKTAFPESTRMMDRFIAKTEGRGA